MKTLVVFYSRTGTTKKVGEVIAQKLGAEIEEIKDTVERVGAVGYLKSGRDALKRRLTRLEAARLDPAGYDLVVIGTPIWSWNMSVPVRTYLTEQKENFRHKVAFFCTMGGSGAERAFSEMAEISGKKPEAVFSARTIDVQKDNFLPALEKFLETFGNN